MATFARGVERAANVLMIVMMGVMVTLVFGNVVLRYVFNSGITFSEEVSRFVFMWLTLIGALLVMKDNAHLGMNTIVARLGEKGQRLCRFVSDLGALICCVLLAHGTYRVVVISLEDHSPVTGVPLGLVYLCLLIASVGMALVLAWSIFRVVTGRMPREALVNDVASAGE